MYELLLAYLMLLGCLVTNWKAVNKSYQVNWNGSRWVVRDNLGRFVRITSNPWDVMSLVF